MELKRLYKAVKAYKTYKAFEGRVLAFLKWYQVPMTWTKKDLETFYYSNKKA